MTDEKVLVCIDFDHTLVDCNTDIRIKSLADGNSIPDGIESLSKLPNGWTTYMREIFKFLFKNGISKENYTEYLSTLPLVNGMKELLLYLHEKNCEIIILSDANSFFIQHVLHHNQLHTVISKMFTNPAEFDNEGCLQIEEFQKQNYCTRCPENLCKGSILENYVSKRSSENVKFCRIFYIGDGYNDVCAALRLQSGDFVFARKGYRLLKAVEKLPAGSLKAAVIPWETGYDIKNVMCQ